MLQPQLPLSANARYEILFCFAFLGSQQALAARVRSGSRFAIELTWRQWVIHLWHHTQRPRKTVAHRSHSWCLAYAIAQPNTYDSESTQKHTHTCTQTHTLTRAGTRWRKIRIRDILSDYGKSTIGGFREWRLLRTTLPANTNRFALCINIILVFICMFITINFY